MPTVRHCRTFPSNKLLGLTLKVSLASFLVGHPSAVLFPLSSSTACFVSLWEIARPSSLRKSVLKKVHNEERVLLLSCWGGIPEDGDVSRAFCTNGVAFELTLHRDSYPSLPPSTPKYPTSSAHDTCNAPRGDVPP